MNTQMISQIQTHIKGFAGLNESMSNHTTFGIGGSASLMIFPIDKQDLIGILKFINKHDLPKYFIGSGSNLLVSDNGFDGIVISLKKTFKKLSFLPDLSFIAETGVMLGTLVKQAIQHGITGLESMIGVPGTVGGALIMNAGAYGSEISNLLISASTLTVAGEEKEYSIDDLIFSYRSSSFIKNEIIISASFQGKYGTNEIIQNARHIASGNRKSTQPLKFRSAGSIFKNHQDFAAGYLIDKCGLKGTRCGGAEISPKHANFIVNHGSATSGDVVELIRIAQREVQRQFDIKLDLEIELLGFKDEIMKELHYD
ncbi:MAG: UDP-N-acetylmuramate dehydrogenase [Candidatus Marinimicrobia bacterium]|jgi:UDP-N-acetylmuramate dehydrogenase|nr:UDP-N-acetylmuramate dehydrogenase [Candidatus Neomarinimicrobiota bacterium]